MTDSFAGQYLQVFDRIRAARADGDQPAERQATAELLDAYRRLGRREAGTVDEQNAFIIARSLGVLPGELQDLGIRPDELPLDDRRSVPAPPPDPEPFSREQHHLEGSVADRFAHIGGPDEEEPEPRYAVDERPQDNIRHHGKLLPFAVVDTTDGLPVGWYDDRDLAETIADSISRLREAS
ncbi:hypothetical protein [Streptomyces subrutilus]|uniref:Uncharacterized protein n=1 Tax=Streptomyces subrutilus TaxID=36818 RepID=A0A1E5NXN0_9ACTN|nr:hypothetical protein [Streptomyces subrutilus]OEJ21018.1 hypothetical protein BGK67_34545 [Streptomyces subrutilus]